jgi:hypothetical protein
MDEIASVWVPHELVGFLVKSNMRLVSKGCCRLVNSVIVLENDSTLDDNSLKILPLEANLDNVESWSAPQFDLPEP